MRDHMLGFPDVLLALDPEPQKPDRRTTLRARLTPEEQAERVKLDVPPREMVAFLDVPLPSVFTEGFNIGEHGDVLRFDWSPMTVCAGQAPAMATAFGVTQAGALSGALTVVPAGAPIAGSLVTLCHCKDRPASECPGEWEPGCDLGANPKHVKVHEPETPAHPVIPEGAMWQWMGDGVHHYYRWRDGIVEEHRHKGQSWVLVYSGDLPGWLKACEISRCAPIPGARIPHDGGPCPVPPETRIAKVWMSGPSNAVYEELNTAAVLYWDWSGTNFDIVAYEVAP